MPNPNACADPEAMSGYHKFQNEEGESYGSFEVFWLDDHDDLVHEALYESGWYWWPCFPGCLPDCEEPTGPFETSVQAYSDAMSTEQ